MLVANSSGYRSDRTQNWVSTLKQRSVSKVDPSTHFAALWNCFEASRAFHKCARQLEELQEESPKKHQDNESISTLLIPSPPLNSVTSWLCNSRRVPRLRPVQKFLDSSGIRQGYEGTTDSMSYSSTK